ncbi:MAG: hypothetical protein IT429_23745 [Gemmataceae bacterium]|nr:hypothetical protein [Gemmataceae bacterium]
MRGAPLWLSALVCVGLLAPPALAQARYPQWRPVPPQYPPPMPHLAVPDATGPGYYTWCPDGTYQGPHYYLRPAFEPFQGFRPQFNNGVPVAPLLGGAGGGGAGGGTPPVRPVFPTHPYARSPRDFFMWTEAQQELHTRERLPRFVP